MDGPLIEAADENTCRICRGEGTQDTPLFYPCKCRGSIKYIHQECLEEWLKHSNKKDVTCDICHQKYKFTTVFQENTPDRVPLLLVLKKLKSISVGYGIFASRMLLLLVGCIVQIPLFWGMTSRMFSWCLDGTVVHDSFLVHIVYGDQTLEGDPWSRWNLMLGLSQTYMNSLLTLIVVCLINAVLFLEYERVCKDPGFAKLVKRNIGEEHVRAVRLGNPAQPVQGNHRLRAPEVRRRDEERMDEALRNLENLQRLVQDVDALDNPVVAEAVERILARQIELQRQRMPQQVHQDAALGDPDNLLEEEDELEDPDFIPEDGSDIETNSEDEHDDGHYLEENDAPEFERFAIFDGNDHPDDINDAESLNRPRRAVANRAENAVPDIPNVPNNNRLEDDHMIDVIPLAQQAHPEPLRFDFRQEPVAAPVAAAADPVDPLLQGAPPALFNANGDGLLASLDLASIMFFADVLIAVYLFLFYFVPSVIGTLNFQFCAYVLFLAFDVSTRLLSRTALKPQKVSYVLSGVYSRLAQLSPGLTSYLRDAIASPITDSIFRIYDQSQSLTNMERGFPLLYFYVTSFVAMMLYLRVQESRHSSDNPLLGFHRKMYIFWFSIMSTLKVFLIFALELVVFPSLCGLLLKFVLMPLLPTIVLFTSQNNN